MTTIDKAALLAPRLTEHDVAIPGVGTVRIRSLSRTEVLAIKGQTLPLVEMERYLLSRAMLEPALTEADVEAWQQTSGAGEIEDLSAHIMRVSGLRPEAPKDAMRRFRGDTRS